MLEIKNTIDLTVIVSFILGLLSTTIVESIKSFHKKERIRKLTIAISKKYLENEIPKIREEYNLVKTALDNITAGDRKTEIFEGFSSAGYRCFSAEEYYKTFKKDFLIIDEVRNIIDVVKPELPYEIVLEYVVAVKSILDEAKIPIGQRKQYVVTSIECVKLLTDATRKIDCRLEDLTMIEEKLTPLVNKYQSLAYILDDIDE